MSHIRHPIVGDVTYGGRVQLSKGMAPELIDALRHFKRQALHAFAIGFTHPTTGEDIHFNAEPPEDFKALLETLRQDSARK
jgi:23S rRNA pseudouridine1911/1915/1917 synthase